MSADIEVNEKISFILRTKSVSLSVFDKLLCEDCDHPNEFSAEATLNSRAEIDTLIEALTHARDMLFPVA